MTSTPRSLTDTDLLLAGALRGDMGEAQAMQLAQADPTAMTRVLLALARRIAEQEAPISAMHGRGTESPATPSGMVPV